MKDLSEEQINTVYEWLNTWEQLRNTAIPLRFKEEFKNNDLLSVSYLIEKHPELNEEQANDLLDFCQKKTIRRKECYGDGEIMYAEWRR